MITHNGGYVINKPLTIAVTGNSAVVDFVFDYDGSGTANVRLSDYDQYTVVTASEASMELTSTTNYYNRFSGTCTGTSTCTDTGIFTSTCTAPIPPRCTGTWYNSNDAAVGTFSWNDEAPSATSFGGTPSQYFPAGASVEFLVYSKVSAVCSTAGDTLLYRGEVCDAAGHVEWKLVANPETQQSHSNCDGCAGRNDDNCLGSIMNTATGKKGVPWWGRENYDAAGQAQYFGSTYCSRNSDGSVRGFDSALSVGAPTVLTSMPTVFDTLSVSRTELTTQGAGVVCSYRQILDGSFSAVSMPIFYK